MQTKELRVFFCYAIILFLFVAFTFYSISIRSAFIYQLSLKIHVILEYSLIAYFLHLLYRNKLAKRIILFSLIPYFIYAIYDYTRHPNVFSQNVLLVEFLFGIMFLVYFFYEKMQTIVLYPIYQRISFWICVAFFLYFSGNFFCFIFSKSSTDPAFREQLKLVYGLVTISKNVVLSLALFGNEPANEAEEDHFHIPNDINLDEFNVNQFKNT